jgi:hypothetical protein
MRRRELAVEAMFRRVLCTKRETAEPMSIRTSSKARTRERRERERERKTRHRGLSTAKELTAARRTAAEKNRRWGRLWDQTTRTDEAHLAARVIGRRWDGMVVANLAGEPKVAGGEQKGKREKESAARR